MTKEGQKTHNVPTIVRIWGKYDILPSSWQLEQDMKKRLEKPKEVRQEPQETGIIPFKPND